ncbi:MAG: glycosyltransferase family 39 protein [Candidatus Moraniibacteriota bacterium]
MLKKYFPALILTLVIALNLFLGLGRLGSYSAVDEPYWTYGRTSKFWTAIAQQKWRSTNINDKPGITVAILSGFGLLKYDPMSYESMRGDVKTPAQLAAIDGINFYFRLPIFLFCTFSLLLFYFFLKKLFDQTTALLGFVFMGLSPILLGISMIINPDSLLWIFLPLSLLSYFVFQKTSIKKYLLAAGIFLGLSLLTKYVANLLYIFFFLLPFLEYILAEEKPELRSFLAAAFKNYLFLAVISIATFYLLYPATWTHPKVLLEGTFLSKAFVKTWPLFTGLVAVMLVDTLLLKNKITQPILTFFSQHKKTLSLLLIAIFLALILLVLGDVYLSMKPFDLEAILSSPKGLGLDGGILTAFANGMLADMYSLIFGFNPLILLLFIVGLLVPLQKNTPLNQTKKIVLYFVLFILLYYLASTVNNVAATVRYQIILYPLAFIIAAIGGQHLLQTATVGKYKFITPFSTALVFFVILTFSLFNLKPFYFTYASSLLPKQYLLNTKDMGDGSFEAAAYLNALPNARQLVVWSDKGAVCTEFVGTCNIGFSKKDLTGKTYDYFVISAGRVNRSLKLSGSANDIINFKTIYSTSTPAEKTLTLAGRPSNFVKIISAQAVK